MSETRDPPADDLRSLIAAATAENVREATPPPPIKPPPAAASGRDSPAAAETADQDQDHEPERGVEAQQRAARKLARERGLEEPPERAGESAEPADQEASEGERESRRDKAAATGAAEAPQHWAQADKDKFAALPADARAPFLDLYKRMENGFRPKLQRAADLERDYGELDRSVFIPEQRRILADRGISVSGMINAWAGVERSLGGAPQMRDDMIARIIHNYQANPVEIARRLNELRGFAQQAPASDQAAATNGAAVRSAVDPALAARLDRLENDQRARTQAEQNDRHAAAQRQIENFANEVDDDGQLTHPFYAEVIGTDPNGKPVTIEDEMTGLAQLDRAMGKAPDLTDLYNRAVWGSPATREKQLALQRDAEAKRQAAERTAKADKARRAGSSITGAPSPGTRSGNAEGDLSLRDTIKANMAVRPQTSGGRGRI